MNITKWSLSRPVTSLMVFTCFIVVGLIASRLVPIEYFPDISFPGLYIEIPYKGSTPEEVERLITRPVEEAVATVSGIEEMNSDSRDDEAGIFVRFNMGTDINLKSIEVREKIDGIRHLLPEDQERIFVYKFTASDQPILNLRISSERDLSDAYDLLYRNVKQRVERIPGVSKVDLYGVEKKQLQIKLDPNRLIAHNVNFVNLVETLRRSNFSVTAGKIDEAGKRYLVRPVGDINDPEKIENLVIGPNNLKVKDIANVSYETPKVDYGRHLDRKYAIGLDVFKESGANTVDVSNAVLEEVESIKQTPQMKGIRIFELENQATGILSSLEELLSAGVLGALFSIIVLYFFLRNFRTTMIVALAVPFSLIVTLACLFFLGMSLNILTMMGLMLAVGMLVDNAVVVTENIHRHQYEGGSKQKTTVKAVKEVAMAVTAGTLTTIIVFLPNIVSQRDMSAIYLKHVAVTICIALIASLLISLTIIPLLTSRYRTGKVEAVKPTIIDKGLNGYGRLLSWFLRHRYASVGIILLILASVAIPARFVKTEMFPPIADRVLRLYYNVNGHYVLDKVEDNVYRVEDYLYSHQKDFDIKSVYSFYRPGYAMSTILLVDKDKATKSVDAIKDAIREDMPKIPIGKPSFEFQSRSVGEAMRVHLIGEASDELTKLSDEVIRRLKKTPGFSDVRSEAETGSEEVRVTIDRERSRFYGMSTRQIAGIVSNAMRGQQLRRIRDKQGEVDVVLLFSEKDRQSVEDLRNVPITISNGQPVKLSSIAHFDIRKSPHSIHRENRLTSLAVIINPMDITKNEAREKINAVMNQIDYPAGYGWSYGRSFREDEQTMNEMMINIILALILIYLVMAALFESVLYPSSIITSIIFAVIGVYWFFMLTDTIFSFMAMVGILILMGIVVNNGIVLIDHINHLRAGGLSRNKAIVQGGMDRMRPILMTAGTTVLGLIPLCVVTTQVGGDGPPYFPMARAIVGGLTFSTIVTMLILPTIYVMLDDLKNWSVRVIRAAKSSDQLSRIN